MLACACVTVPLTPSPLLFSIYVPGIDRTAAIVRAQHPAIIVCASLCRHHPHHISDVLTSPYPNVVCASLCMHHPHHIHNVLTSPSLLSITVPWTDKAAASVSKEGEKENPFTRSTPKRSSSSSESSNEELPSRISSENRKIIRPVA